MKKAPPLAEASPYKSVAAELEGLRRTFRGLCQRYADRIDAEIAALLGTVVAAGALATDRDPAGARIVPPAKPNAAARNKRARTLAQVHALRDMLTLLRTLQIKPAEGRRKDLKKVESMIADLRLLSEGVG